MSDDEFLYSVRGPKSWIMMTSQEIAAALKETDVCLVPCGAIEQHAGGLPVGQDNFQIEEITRRAIVKLRKDGKKAIFGPTIPYGPISNLKFPGSINIRPTTMILLIKEVCMNLYRDGIRHIVLVKGHDMTLGSLMVAARELAEDTDDDLKVVVANWLPWIVKRLPEIFQLPKGKRDGHGGAGEASRMMWQHPELMVKEELEDFDVDAVDLALDPQDYDLVDDDEGLDPWDEERAALWLAYLLEYPEALDSLENLEDVAHAFHELVTDRYGFLDRPILRPLLDHGLAILRQSLAARPEITRLPEELEPNGAALELVGLAAAQASRLQEPERARELLDWLKVLDPRAEEEAQKLSDLF